MRIALLNTITPFGRGGAEILVDDLYSELEKRGHDVERFRIPFPMDFTLPLLNLTFVSQLLRFDDYDRVIAFKYPAYCVKHPNKVIWFFHQFRQIYELWDHDHGLKPTPENIGIKEIIKRTDDEYIPFSRHIFTNADEVKTRLMMYNGINSEVLTPPLKDEKSYYKKPSGNYFYYPSRINSMKRQLMAVEALKYTKTSVELIISGVSESEEYICAITDIIKKNNLEKRVTIINRWITEEEKKELFANSLGVLYTPYKEDSCGFVTFEALYSHKPVITCEDSGGVHEFIQEGYNGIYTEPTPQSIATAMDRLFLNKEEAEKMGENGYNGMLNMKITWDETIKRLLA